MEPNNLLEYQKVQAVAKTVLNEIGNHLRATDSESTIARRAIAMLAARGLTDTWYYNCPALVLAGTRSCDSISGRDYQPSDEPVGEFNLITIDLSPCSGEIWGDCARSYCIEDGRWTTMPRDPEFQAGIALTSELHNLLRTAALPSTTFAQLWALVQQHIELANFENLDFMGNFGHTIPTKMPDRVFIKRDSQHQCGQSALFTFEPHVRQCNGQWGFKHEEIYYFNHRRQIVEL